MVDIMFKIIPIFIGIIFVMTFAMILSPKFRGKMMSRQIKAQKYMMEEAREDLKSISDDMAYASKDGIKTMASAIKDGFNQSNIFCKYCGCKIDADSKFCKKCGKEQ